ncbi:MAG: hypothetical protein KDA22_01075, partial [Phycisphaerales bacterium]|nr:hypothetical protein [Phycisphaerales bacterium]
MTSPSAQNGPPERSATVPTTGTPRTFARAAFGTSILVLWREWRAGRPRSVAHPRPAHRSVRAAIDASGLPSELSSIVDATVRGTRLRRRERIDIACELASHLREGLEAGIPAAALRDRFGDPAGTARMLRAAAVAKRGAMDRAFGATVKWGGIGIAAVVVFYLAAAVRLSFLEPVIRFDPLARLRAGLPEATATAPAWPMIRSAMDNLRPVTGIPRTYEAVYRERPHPPMEIVLGDTNGIPITPEAEREAAALVRSHAAEIALLRQ